MALTVAQIATLKAAIEGNSSLVAFVQTRDVGSIAAYYATNSNPAVLIWRPAIEKSEFDAVANWTAFSTQPVQIQNVYFALTSPVNATNAGILSAFALVWPVVADQTPLVSVASRVATRGEALFTSNGVCATFGYTITAADVAAAKFNADGTLK